MVYKILDISVSIILLTTTPFFFGIQCHDGIEILFQTLRPSLLDFQAASSTGNYCLEIVAYYHGLHTF